MWNLYSVVPERTVVAGASVPARTVHGTMHASSSQHTPADALRQVGDRNNGVYSEYTQQLRRIYAKLYPYQRELFRESALQDSIIYLQTGGGKTWVAATLISLHLAMHPSARIFFVVRTVALALQQTKVLQDLIGVTVACVVGQAREFRSAEFFCAAPHCRVAVIVDSKFFEWLSATPALVTERRVSLVLMDEVHHAQSGMYKRICERFYQLRDRSVGQTVDLMRCLDGERRSDRFYNVGGRSPAATVLAYRLQNAELEERRLRAHLLSTNSCDSFNCQSPAGNEGDGLGLRVASPVLELLLCEYPRDMPCPQLIGLTASPVRRFHKIENDLLELFLITRCRLVGVVDEVADLERHRPNPAIVMLSYLPRYEERVLQTALRRSLTHIFRRMEALVPEGAAQKRLTVLRVTSVVSPGYITYCDQFQTDTAMSETFKCQLRIPPGSALVRAVQTYIADQTAVNGDSTGSADRTTPPSLIPSWTKTEEINMCADFILFGLQFLKAVSLALIALQELSYEEMMISFCGSYPREEIDRMSRTCLPITGIVLRPVILSLFKLMASLRLQHPLSMGCGNASANTDTTSAEVSAPPLRLPTHTYTVAEALQAGQRCLPRAVQEYSTHVQVLIRLITELAIVAVAMSNAPSGVPERHLRVLVFVETRETAAYLMRILSKHCRFAYNVLRPGVLLGQKNSQKRTGNYMTRAQQTALLDKFRAGEMQLVFATTVAEEGIDVPACHVVLRCNRQIDLSNFVQSCGRLRMKHTIFISLSNLLNGHPRLGFMMGAVHGAQGLLHDMAKRCRNVQWNLEKDALITGKTSTALDNDDHLPVMLSNNPSEATQFTVQELSLLSLQRSILTQLQHEHQTEVFCVHKRDLAGEPVEVVSVTIMMSIPVRVEDTINCGNNSSSSSPSFPPRFLTGSLLYVGSDREEGYEGRVPLGAKAAASTHTCFDRIAASATGGLIRAGQRAFADFCHCAQQKGYLTEEGKVVASSGGARGAVLSSREQELAALHVMCSYAKMQTPSLVFLGQSLCLCTRRTWPPAVLKYFSRGRATVMTVYNADYWSSRIEPQRLLREELSAIKVGPAKFFIAKKGGVAEENLQHRADEWESTSEDGSLDSNVAYSTTLSNSQDSRNWYRSPTHPGGNDNSETLGLLPGEEERAEVEFLLPVSVVGPGGLLAHSPSSRGKASFVDPSTQPASLSTCASSVKTSSTESGCYVVECDVEVPSTGKSGQMQVTRMRRVCIRYSGAQASKVVSLEGLRKLGVTVVYNVDETELMAALTTCRQVGPLE